MMEHNLTSVYCYVHEVLHDGFGGVELLELLNQECSFMVPCTLAVIVICGLPFHLSMHISGSYFLFFFLVVVSENQLCQYVNSMICSVWDMDGVIGVGL